MRESTLTSRSGYSLVEFMVAASIAASVLLLFGGAMVSLSKHQTTLQKKAENLVRFNRTLSQIMKIGQYAKDCRKGSVTIASGSSVLSLNCTVEFTEGYSEPVSFTHFAAEKLLKYTRNYREIWSIPASEFQVCSGSEVMAGGCLANGETMSPSMALNNNYYRFRATLLHENGEGFSSIGAFYLRNAQSTGNLEYPYLAGEGL